MNKNNFSTHICKYIFLTLVFTTLFISAGAQNVQSITITTGNNPPVVIMGDSLVFVPRILSTITTTISDAELEVEVPAGFELLPSTPSFKTAGLSDDKRKGRIQISSLETGVPLDVTVYVKALCDAETAAQMPDMRRIKYTLYSSDDAGADILTSNNTKMIQTFNNPILNITYPPAEVVSLGQEKERTFTVIQTGKFSHVNNIEVVAMGDTDGFLIDKVEVRRNASKQWQQIAVEKQDGQYRYLIKRDEVFTPEKGYPKHQLEYSDTLLIRETVRLRECDKGSLDYSVSYGDGITFCTPASTGNVTYSQPVYAYTPDIYQTAYSAPQGPKPANDGRYVTAVSNNSGTNEATMHDLYVDCSGVSGYIFRSAYFTDNTGAPIKYNGDTVFIYMEKIDDSQYQVRLDSLNKPAMKDYYTARGLSDLDGDGRYGDLQKGKTFYFAIRYNYVFNTEECSPGLFDFTIRIFRLHYKTFCKGDYQNFVRNYVVAETTGNGSTTTGNGSTNVWQGLFSFGSIRNTAITSTNLQLGAQVRISGQLYYSGDGSIIRARGDNLFELIKTSSYKSRFYSTIVLPTGLSFDNAVNSVKIGSATLTKNTHYTVSAGLDTIRIQWHSNWTSSWGSNNYTFDIAVKNNGNVDNTKTLQIYHEYDYGNTGVLQQFGCVSAPVFYSQSSSCSYLDIIDLDVERRSFGYTSVTDKNTRVTNATDARNKGFNMKIISPYDDVDVEGLFKAGGNISTADGNQIHINFSYGYNNATALFDTVAGSSKGISLYYDNSTTPIPIPNSAMTKTWTPDTQTQSITFDVAPYLREANIDALEATKTLKIVMHLRATTALPTTGVDIFPQMNSVTVIGSDTYECSTWMDKVRIWDSDWAKPM